MDNAGYGIKMGWVGFSGNVLTGNNGDNTNGQVSGGSEMGTNFCGFDTTCL